jgi:hypothetical protein
MHPNRHTRPTENLTTHACDSPNYYIYEPHHLGRETSKQKMRRLIRVELEDSIRTTMETSESMGGPRTSPLPRQQETNLEDTHEIIIKTEEERNKRVATLNEDILTKSNNIKAAKTYMEQLQDAQHSAAARRITYIGRETNKSRAHYLKRHEILQDEWRNVNDDLTRETCFQQNLQHLLYHIQRKPLNTRTTDIQEEDEPDDKEEDESNTGSNEHLNNTIEVTRENIQRIRRTGTHTQTGHPVRRTHLVNTQAICSPPGTKHTNGEADEIKKHSKYIKDNTTNEHACTDPMSYYTSSAHNKGHMANTMH